MATITWFNPSGPCCGGDPSTVHFSNLLIFDRLVTDWQSPAFCGHTGSSCTPQAAVNEVFLTPGAYNNSNVFGTIGTLDGICVPANTRLRAWDDEDQTGNLIFDITGPIIRNHDAFELSEGVCEGTGPGIDCFVCLQDPGSVYPASEITLFNLNGVTCTWGSMPPQLFGSILID